jgi:PAS domain S-box-containing protein
MRSRVRLLDWICPNDVRMNQTLTLDCIQLDEELRALIDLAPDAIFVADRGGHLCIVNDAACKLSGWSHSQLLGRPIGCLFAPAGDEENGLKLPWQHDRPRAVQARLRHADASWVAVEVRGRLLPSGTIQAWVREYSGRANEAGDLGCGKSSATQRSVLDYLPMGVLIFRADGELYFNDRSEQLLGMQLSPAGGTAQYEGRFLSADGKPLSPGQSISCRVLQGGESMTAAEYLIARPDGSRIPIMCCAGPIRGADGTITAGVAVFQDATERKRLEHTLGANERMLQTIFDLLPVGIWRADQSGQIIGNNPAAQRIWEGARYIDLSQYGQYKGWRVDTGEPIAAEDWALARAITHGETTPGELVRIQCFDGSFKTIINSGAPLRDDNGDITGAIVVNEDITLLHEAQVKQRAGEELLRTIFNLLPVGLWVADRDGNVTFTNPAAEHIWSGEHFARPAQGVEYKAWWVETGQPIGRDDWALARALRGETSHSELIRIQCFDGSSKTILNWAAPIRSDDGEIVGAIALNEDVTALQYTQEQLRSAVRERESILAIVAHDLRNPLTALRAHAAAAHLAAGRLPGGEKVVSQAASIADIGKQMSGLVSDLLSVGAAGAGGHHMLALSPVNPASLLAQAADAVRPLAADKQLILEIKPADGLPALRADVDRILRVLGNLLDNAIKFTEPQGRISISAKSATTGIMFSVSNSGPAVAAADLDAMFQPFWQADRSNRAGTGLGLAICRSIVEAHGGTIWAEPAEGKRLRVCFVLPRA